MCSLLRSPGRDESSAHRRSSVLLPHDLKTDLELLLTAAATSSASRSSVWKGGCVSLTPQALGIMVQQLQRAQSSMPRPVLPSYVPGTGEEMSVGLHACAPLRCL